MQLVFRDYGRPLKQAKEPLLPRDDVMEFYVKNNTKELEKNINCRFVQVTYSTR